MIKFVLLKYDYCENCKKIILHEFGFNQETGHDVKQCIRCDTLTEVENEKCYTCETIVSK